MTDVGVYWDLIQARLDAMEFPPSKRRLAARLGVSPQTLTNWQSMSDLPRRENLEAVAAFIGQPYGVVLEAALRDTGYHRGSRLAVRRGRGDVGNDD